MPEIQLSGHRALIGLRTREFVFLEPTHRPRCVVRHAWHLPPVGTAAGWASGATTTGCRPMRRPSPRSFSKVAMRRFFVESNTIGQTVAMALPSLVQASTNSTRTALFPGAIPMTRASIQRCGTCDSATFGPAASPVSWIMIEVCTTMFRNSLHFGRGGTLHF